MKEKKRQKVYRVVMLIIVVALITFVITTVLTYNGSIKYIVSATNNIQQYNNTTTKKLDALFATITELLEEKYIGDVNQEELIDGALSGLVASVGDVYTAYYTKEELEDFTAETLGNFVGIGVYMKANTDVGYVEIVEPMKDSPAEKAGIKSGDFIIKVDGEEYKANELEKLSSAIKGEEGTEIILTIKRGEEFLDITVKREKIHRNYVTGEVLEGNIGYIAIETFDEGSTGDFKAEYTKLLDEGAKSLIIDLRGNGGGLVSEALSITDLFCDKDQITLISVDKDGKEEITKSRYRC